MQEGNHEVRTAWGFLAVRLPMPEDKEWAAARTTILQALGVMDPQGKPTARLDVVKAGDLAKRVAGVCGGGGGGRPDMAQAGGKDPSKIAEAFAEAEKAVTEALGV